MLRYAQDPGIEDYKRWIDAFSDSMRKVYAAHKEDLDVTAIFAEAPMNRTPWLLWDLPSETPKEGA